MPFGALQLLEEPTREWVSSLQRSIAEYDWNPVIGVSLCNCTVDMVQTHSQYLGDFLYPIPIIFGDCECSPRYVFHNVAITANCGDGAVPLVSSGDKKIDGLTG